MESRVQKQHNNTYYPAEEHWYGWGSPIGLSIWFLSLSLVLVAIGVFIYLLHSAAIIK